MQSIFKISLLSLLLLTACESLMRTPESGYSQASQKNSYQRKKYSSSSSNEFSLKPSKTNISEKMQLKQLENSLSSRKEMEQYSKALPWFHNEEERVQFLRLKGFENRQDWLDQNNFSMRSKSIQQDFTDLVDAQDIALGMPQNLVRQSWGDPEAIDVSGNPSLKNERWKYSKLISSPDGYKPEKKIVYFEGGRVVGWEIE